MSKQLESALEAVARMSPGSEIDPALWREVLEQLRRECEWARKTETSFD